MKPPDSPERLGPRATIAAAVSLVALLAAYMVLNRESVAGPAARCLAALRGTPPAPASTETAP